MELFQLVLHSSRKPPDMYFPTPLIQSLGEKKNKPGVEKITYTVLHHPQSPLSSLRISLSFLVRYILKT